MTKQQQQHLTVSAQLFAQTKIKKICEISPLKNPPVVVGATQAGRAAAAAWASWTRCANRGCPPPPPPGRLGWYHPAGLLLPLPRRPDRTGSIVNKFYVCIWNTRLVWVTHAHIDNFYARDRSIFDWVVESICLSLFFFLQWINGPESGVLSLSVCLSSVRLPICLSVCLECMCMYNIFFSPNYIDV